jgi:hypothetical protein
MNDLNIFRRPVYAFTYLNNLILFLATLALKYFYTMNIFAFMSIFLKASLILLRIMTPTNIYPPLVKPINLLTFFLALTALNLV